VLGDLAQGTAPWAVGDWRTTLTHLGKPEAHLVPLTTGFRVPREVVEWTNRLLPALAVDVPEAVSLRRDGWLSISPVDDVEAATVAEVRAALEYEGSVGVIAADARSDRLAEALRAGGIDLVLDGVSSPASDSASDPLTVARVTVLPATWAKGLEYDHVVVAEPAEIVEAEARGLNRLYVVLTRAVSRLSVVHARPLPAVLT
jgi:DNA helicase IV